jgi:hypothetical protein
MESYKDLLKKSNQHQLILLVVFILYILLNVQTPNMLATLIDNIYGNVVVVLMALFILTHMNPIVGVVALYAAYELIQRSSVTTGSAAIRRYLPTEIKKGKHFSAFNQFPVTLEEEVVKQMAPLVETSGPNHLHYKPVANETYNAVDLADSE